MNYYTPGQTYIFRSRIDENQTKVISIVFDEAANATIFITVDSVLPVDESANFFFGPSAEFQFNEQSNAILITGDLSNYWYIYFDNPDHQSDNATTVGGPNVTVTCNCKKSMGPDPACEVSWVLENDMLCATCVPNGSCEDCKEPKWSSGIVNTTSIIVKASTILIL
ncbi:MAG: hypothetical protein IT237_12705 [Bacteroidia bacterium]|jgi:hypothetical protein|nr:hypothetical protein [Bacteroidia bacterium]